MTPPWKRGGGGRPWRAPTPPTQLRQSATRRAPGPSTLRFRAPASGPGAAPKSTQQTPANSGAHGKPAARGCCSAGREQAPAARPSPRRVAPTKGGPGTKAAPPVGPRPHLPRVLLVLAGVYLVTLGAVLVAGLGRHAPASGASRDPGASTSPSRRLAFGGGLVSVLGGARRLHGLLLTRFRHARPWRAAPATSSHDASGRRRSRPGSRPPPAGPDAHLAADDAAGPARPHPPGRHRGLGRAHACAAGPLPRLPTEPPRPRALLPRPALPLPLPPLHESHQHRSSTRPARCCRLTMPTRGALYNAGAEATSQQTTCSLASPAGHSTPRRLPIGRGGALTVNPGGLCPHLRIRASRGLAEGCRVR